jgi:predicted AAA+ superfamily ATPase
MENLILIFPIYWKNSYFCGMKPIERIAKIELEKWLGKGKVIVLTGARQVGKTTLFQMMFQEKNDLQWLNADETNVRERLQVLNVESLKSVIGQKKWVIIDEIQRIPNSGILLKLLGDNFKDVQFLATGSSALDIAETIFEPLTGRHLLFHLHPLMLAEMYKEKTPFELEQKIPFNLVFGCYPDVYNFPDQAETLLKNLTNQYLYKDVLVWKDIRKPEILEKLLKLLAHQIGSEVSVAELANQLKVKSETVESYIDLLEKSFVIFRLPAFSNNPRKEISKMNKIFFWDNGIRNAIVHDFDDLSVRYDVGKLWENFAISERMKYLNWKMPNVKCYFWRNYNQSEVDFVEAYKKQITAYEIKWNSHKNHKVSAAFTNAYPNAKTEIITPLKFAEFCGLGV